MTRDEAYDILLASPLSSRKHMEALGVLYNVSPYTRQEQAVIKAALAFIKCERDPLTLARHVNKISAKAEELEKAMKS